MVLGMPDRFVDVSQFREVPDNQEVFSDPGTDQSLIVEILELASEAQGANSVVLHFNELADSNDATAREVVRVEPLTPEDVPNFDASVERFALYGTQQVAKHHEEAQNVVNIYMLLVRLPAPINSDLLMTFNDSVQVDPKSSAATYKKGRPSSDENMAMWKAIIASFGIKDYSIFSVGA